VEHKTKKRCELCYVGAKVYWCVSVTLITKFCPVTYCVATNWFCYVLETAWGRSELEEIRKLRGLIED